METVYIYGLFDPRNGHLRYIGKTNNLKERLRDHITFSRGRKGQGYKFNPPKEKWIRSLLSEGLKPSIQVLEECTEDTWREVEISWIRLAREMGISITNISDGGDGFGSGESNPYFGKKLTEEHKRKCSISLTGRKHSEETKQKIGLAHRGKTISKEQRERISKNHPNMKGKENPFYGKKHSEETKSKISQANTGRIRTPEQKEKMGKGSIGQKWAAKLNKEQVLSIREKWSANISKRGLLLSIATEFGVSRNTIWLIVHNKTWMDIYE